MVVVKGVLTAETRDDRQLVDGAEILEASMVLGDDAYDVVPGFVGEPVGDFEARAKDSIRPPTPAANDEDLLAQFLLKSL